MRNVMKLVAFIFLLFIIAGCQGKETPAVIQNTQDPQTKQTLSDIQNTQKEILAKLSAIEANQNKILTASQAQPRQAAAAPGVNAVVNIPIGNSPIKGNKKAPVTIVEFSDFQCPYCAQIQPTLSEVLKAYPKEVKLVFKHYPLSFHPHAKNAAKATLAAMEQGKFWEMHDAVFANFSQLSNEKFKELASQIGLNMEKFIADYNSDKYEPQLLQDFNAARAAGVTGTPTLFINGKRLMRRSVDDFKEAINNALKGK